MALALVFASVGSALGAIYAFTQIPKPETAPPPSLDDLEAPTAEEGRSIPVLFGRRKIASPNVVWWGDLNTTPVRAKVKGVLGSSYKNTGQYKVHLGMHMVVGIGPFDSIDKIEVAEKIAWEGYSTGGRIFIDAEWLFGGDKKQGGIYGEVDLDFGYPSQTQNDYLVGQLGEDVPAYRGVVSAILRHVYLGTTTYIKPWAFWGSRIFKKSDGSEQWYSEKAGVYAPGVVIELGGDQWSALTRGLNSGFLSAPVYSVATDGAGVWVAGMGAGFAARSTDSGAGWSALTRGLNSGALGSIWSVATGNGTWLAGLDSGYAARSTDSGATWEAITRGLNSGTTANVIRCLNTDSHGVWVAGLDAGYAARSSDNGTNWSALTRGLNSGSSTLNIYCIATDGNGIWVAGLDSGYAARSTDNGVTWSALTRGLNSGGLGAIRSIATDGSGVWIAGMNSGFAARSSDGGATWSAITKGLNSGSLSSAIFSLSCDTNGVWVAGMDAGYAARSSDNGVTWSALIRGLNGGDATQPIHSVAADHNGIWVAGMGSGHAARSYSAPATRPDDMNPSHIIREALTDRRFALRYAESQIDDGSFSLAADVLFSERMGISLYWTGENSIEEFIGEILRHIDGNCYVDKKTGKWVLRLIREDYSLSNLIVLGENNIVSVADYKQPTIAELINSITVIYWDAETGKDGSITITDQSLIDLQGGTINKTIPYPGFTNYDIASRAAMRDLRTRSSPMITCTITCDRTAADLNIGDPFIVNWPDLKMNNLVMRVNSIDFGDLKKAEIVIECVQDIFGSIGDVGSSVVADQGSGLWVDPTIGDPQPALPRVVMEAPYLFAAETFGAADVASGLGVDPGLGFNLIAAGRQGTETEATAHVDSGGGYIDAGEMGFAPWAVIENLSRIQTTAYITGDSADLTLLELPALGSVGGEFVIVESLDEDTSGQFFNLSRGALDTIPDIHESDSSNSLYLLVWDSYAISDELSYTDGDSNDVRIITIQAGAELATDSAPVDAFTFDSRAVRPYPPANVTINGEYWPVVVTGDAEVAFRHRNRLTQTSGTARDWFDDVDVAAEDGVTYSYDLYDDDTNSLIATASGISASPIVISQSALVANNRLELFSVRDGVECWQRYIAVFAAGGV